MAIEFGAEFNTNATPSQEMLFRLRALAENGALGNTLGSRDDKDSAKQLDAAMAISELKRRLADPEYAALYTRVSEKLDNVYDAVAHAREALDKEQADLDVILTDMRSRAATLNDGTHVYQRADGAWLTESGDEVSKDQMAQADVPEDATRWEDIQPVLKRSQEIDAEQAEIDDYERNVLNPAKARLEDEDNPPSADELAEIDDQIENRPSILRKFRFSNEQQNDDHAAIRRSAADEHMPEGRIDAPNVNGQFAAASTRSDAADLDLDIPARPAVGTAPAEPS